MIGKQISRGVQAGGVFFAFVGAACASAQPAPIENLDQSEFVERVNVDTVDAALSTVTGNHLKNVDAAGNEFLVATATNGLRFEVKFRACEDIATEADADPEQHCKGMYMTSLWDAVPSNQKAGFDAAVQAFLRDNPAVNAGATTDDGPYLIRYVIVDYGTKQGNLVSEFANFIRSATEFQNSIAPYYSN